MEQENEKPCMPDNHGFGIRSAIYKKSDVKKKKKSIAIWFKLIMI
jgi:hypothetical protein